MVVGLHSTCIIRTFQAFFIITLFLPKWIFSLLATQIYLFIAFQIMYQIIFGVSGSPEKSFKLIQMMKSSQLNGFI